MSAYLEFESIQFKNPTALVDALKNMGYGVETGQDLPLYGYLGRERPERAQIVVRRQQVGRAANDLGFRWDEKAQAFIPIISEYDATTNLNAKWRARLQSTYSKVAVTRWLQRQNASVHELRHGQDGLVIIKATVEV